MKVLFVIILTLQLIIPLNTAFGLFSYDSINQRADFVESEKDPYDYVLQYKSDKEFKKWFDENYSDYFSISEAVGMATPVENINSIELTEFILKSFLNQERYENAVVTYDFLEYIYSKEISEIKDAQKKHNMEKVLIVLF